MAADADREEAPVGAVDWSTWEVAAAVACWSSEGMLEKVLRTQGTGGSLYARTEDAAICN